MMTIEQAVRNEASAIVRNLIRAPIPGVRLGAELVTRSPGSSGRRQSGPAKSETFLMNHRRRMVPGETVVSSIWSSFVPLYCRCKSFALSEQRVAVPKSARAKSKSSDRDLAGLGVAHTIDFFPQKPALVTNFHADHLPHPCARDSFLSFLLASRPVHPLSLPQLRQLDYITRSCDRPFSRRKANPPGPLYLVARACAQLPTPPPPKATC